MGVRESQCITTVGEQKRANIHVHHGENQVEFVSMREKRDAMQLASLHRRWESKMGTTFPQYDVKNRQIGESDPTILKQN